ncbi:MAG: hypothetical protein U9Q81_22400 [Pseudomonadota bacterium]|nr:hypothetical protein [Pseudomonadota bacterium]
MKTIVTAIAATFFAAGVNAHDVYHGLAKGDPDLVDQHPPARQVTGVQPSVGDNVDIYGDIATGNTDLFRSDRSGPRDSGTDPDIYHDLGSNPDLQF